jgi:hypothetical protein
MLESRAPLISRQDDEDITSMFKNRTLFPSLMDKELRRSVMNAVRQQGPILSLDTLKRDMSLLQKRIYEPLSNLLVGTKEKDKTTVQKSIKHYFGTQPDVLSLSPHERSKFKRLCYEQLFVYLMSTGLITDDELCNIASRVLERFGISPCQLITNNDEEEFDIEGLESYDDVDIKRRHGMKLFSEKNPVRALNYKSIYNNYYSDNLLSASSMGRYITRIFLFGAQHVTTVSSPSIMCDISPLAVFKRRPGSPCPSINRQLVSGASEAGKFCGSEKILHVSRRRPTHQFNSPQRSCELIISTHSSSSPNVVSPSPNVVSPFVNAVSPFSKDFASSSTAVSPSSKDFASSSTDVSPSSKDFASPLTDVSSTLGVLCPSVKRVQSQSSDPHSPDSNSPSKRPRLFSKSSSIYSCSSAYDVPFPPRRSPDNLCRANGDGLGTEAPETLPYMSPNLTGVVRSEGPSNEHSDEKINIFRNFKFETEKQVRSFCQEQLEMDPTSTFTLRLKRLKILGPNILGPNIPEPEILKPEILEPEILEQLHLPEGSCLGGMADYVVNEVDFITVYSEAFSNPKHNATTGKPHVCNKLPPRDGPFF